MERRRRYQLILLSLGSILIGGSLWWTRVVQPRPNITNDEASKVHSVSRSQLMQRRLEALAEQRQTGLYQTYSYESASIPVEQPR